MFLLRFSSFDFSFLFFIFRPKFLGNLLIYYISDEDEIWQTDSWSKGADRMFIV
jgi:hypothetical protein